jgi:hypothetical protein
VVALLWRALDRAMFVKPDGVYTSYVDNYADLTFHLGVITGFTLGGNFPPEHPELAGTRLAYPFVADFVAAMLVTCDLDLRTAMFLENMVLTTALLGLLHHWALGLTRDRLAALLTPLLVLLNGGLGFGMLLAEGATAPDGIFGMLSDLPHDYSSHGELYRWGNALVYWLVPMRSMLLGIPLFLVVTLLWWRAMGNDAPEDPARERRSMAAAGVVTGLLPLVHAHTFLTLLAMAACLALVYRRFRSWLLFGAIATALALPQIVWATRSSVDPAAFVAWSFGWTKGESNVLWYWFLNTGLFIPLLLVALAWRGPQAPVKRRLLVFYAPFVLCFVVPNLVRLAPWEWDNVKVLACWFLASVPLVALVLARLFRGSAGWRTVAAGLTVILTLSGGLDIWRVVTGVLEWRDFDSDDLALAALIERVTEPRAVLLTAPLHNHPYLLTGRRTFMGYPGRLWTHGLPYADREEAMKKIYAGEPEALELIQQAGIDYIVVGPRERESVPPPNEAFLEQHFSRAGAAAGAAVYRVRRP